MAEPAQLPLQLDEWTADIVASDALAGHREVHLNSLSNAGAMPEVVTVLHMQACR